MTDIEIQALEAKLAQNEALKATLMKLKAATSGLREGLLELREGLLETIKAEEVAREAARDNIARLEENLDAMLDARR